MTQQHNIPVKEFVSEYPFFTISLLNNVIWKNRASLEEAGAVEKVGRANMINKEKFLFWLASCGVTANNAKIKIRSAIMTPDADLTPLELESIVIDLDGVLTQTIDRPVVKRHRRTNEEREVHNMINAEVLSQQPEPMFMDEVEDLDEPEEDDKPEIRIEKVGDDHPMKQVLDDLFKRMKSQLTSPKIVVVEANNADKFEDSLEIGLAHGWLFHGEPMITVEKGLFRTKKTYTQVMIKPVECDCEDDDE